MKDKGEYLKGVNQQIRILKNNKFIVNKLKNELEKRGISRGETQKMLMNEFTIEDMDSDKFLIFIERLYALSKVFELSPYEFFPHKRFKEVREIVFNEEDDYEFPIQLQNASKRGEDFIVSIDTNYFIELYKKNLLSYNYDILPYKFIYKKDKGRRVLDINIKKAERIAEKILQNDYETKSIILMIAKEKQNELKYENGTLTIDSKMIVLNGVHDLNALALVIESKPDFKKDINVIIKHITKKEAIHFRNQLLIKGGVN